MSEWPTVSLREAGVTLIDCDHRTPAAMPIGYPYVTIPQLDDGHIDISTARRISREDFEAWTRKALPLQHDVVLSRRTNPGVTAYVPEGLEFALGQNLVLLRSDGQTVYPPFLRWLVRGPNWWAQIEQFLNVGAVFDSLKCADIPNFRLPIPPMKDQRRIADILSALDDKIELNRRTSEALEAVARAIFRSWFIDDAPAGGSVRGLDEVARFLNGLALQRFPPTADRSLPVIKIAQLRSGDTRDADRASADLPADYVVRDGDVLFSWSGSLECVLWAGGKGALNQHLFKVTSADFPKWFYYLWIHQHLADFREIAAGKATTMGHIQRHHLADAKVSIPPPAVLASADRVLGPMIEQICRRGVEARTLADVRDALLPRLLSGQLTP
jgi:type I restriction enzyme, S subunit